MNKHLFIVFLSILLLTNSNAQTKKIDATLLHKVRGFIPKGYSVLDLISGDLNLDKFQDILLVLRDTAEKNFNDTEFKRPLLILIGHNNKSYSLAKQNDNVVYCYSCGGVFGDPYDGIVIRHGAFTVYHYGGSGDRWANEITFKYYLQDKTWYLTKISDKGWNIVNINKVTSIIKTKKDFGILPFDKYKDENN